MVRDLIVATCLCGMALSSAAWAQPGRLVIAGGAVSRENAEVHTAFLSGLAPNDRVAVIVAASGEPAQSAQSYVQTLARYGVAQDRVDIIALAVMDDPSSKDVDESTWAGNGGAPNEVAKIERAGAIWFTGGDQVRVTRVLLTASGADTPVLASVRLRLASGATVGGTSAGAAIMSKSMIARGDSLAALLQAPLHGSADDSTMDGGRLMVAPGLGFLPSAIVDQHFDRKARLGRLARAIAEAPPTERLGLGVDEDTALVVDLAASEARVVGAGGVTVLDARGATVALRAGRLSISNISLSYAAGEDRINFRDFSLTPAPSRSRIAQGREHYTHNAQSGAGMALPNANLEEALGVELLDNKTSRRLERVSFDGDGNGVRYSFVKAPQTWAAFGDDAKGKGRYSFSGVLFSIEPVRVTIASDRR